MSKFGQSPSKFTPSFGSGGKQDPTDQGETQCIRVLSTVKVNVDLSGGPQHQITYGKGSYGSFFGGSGKGPEFTKLRALDIYEGAFAVKRYGKDDLPGEAGRIEMDVTGPCDTGYKGGSDCPDIEGCCINNSYAKKGATTLTLDYTFREYKNDLDKGRLQGGVGDIVAESTNDQGDHITLFFDLCDPDKVKELEDIYNKVFREYMEEGDDPQKINYQLEMRLELISKNSRQKCFTRGLEETPEVYLKRKELWCGGRVDGEEMWDHVKDQCGIGGAKSGVIGIGSLVTGKATPEEKIVEQMTGLRDKKFGPLGVIRMAKSMPPPAGGWLMGKKGDVKVTNQNEIEYYIQCGEDTGCPEIGGETGNGKWNDEVCTPDYKAHGGLLKVKKTGKEYLGSRQLLLDIIGGIIGDPVKKICEFHTKSAMEVLGEMGEEGKELLCFGYQFSEERDTPLNLFGGGSLPESYDNFTIGMPKCLKLVKNVVT